MARKAKRPAKRPATKKKAKRAAKKRRTLVVLFNLKAGQSEASYERWARTQDIPTATKLKTVDSFKVYRVVGIFGSDQKPPYRYIEVIRVNDIDGIGPEIGKSRAMAGIIAKFQSFADDPLFLVGRWFGG
jgi:hypothetical protein